jgi:hypothetical protein
MPETLVAVAPLTGGRSRPRRCGFAERDLDLKRRDRDLPVAARTPNGPSDQSVLPGKFERRVEPLGRRLMRIVWNAPADLNHPVAGWVNVKVYTASPAAVRGPVVLKCSAATRARVR